MADKIKAWWSEDRKWFCLLIDDGNSKSTVSLTPQEAFELAAAADQKSNHNFGQTSNER